MSVNSFSNVNQNGQIYRKLLLCFYCVTKIQNEALHSHAYLLYNRLVISTKMHLIHLNGNLNNLSGNYNVLMVKFPHGPDKRKIVFN